MNIPVDERRIYACNERAYESGPIIYWMSRDQRSKDNWALLYAQQLAETHNTYVIVCFALVPTFLGATIRHYGFMLTGLEEVSESLSTYNIPFALLLGNPDEEIKKYAEKVDAGMIVTDFDPLKIKMKWKKDLAMNIAIPLVEVDAHNIVPARIASQKREFGAYTIRPKIHRLLDEFLTEYPALHTQDASCMKKVEKIDFDKTRKSIHVRTDVGEVDWLMSGEKAGIAMLKSFIHTRLAGYNSLRNDPNKRGQSNLSPYIHFGQVSAGRIALDVMNSNASSEDKEAFLEELIVRRELSDNFCLYNSEYDTAKGFPAWSLENTHKHARDTREYIYTQEEFETGKTHDELWNAAQMELCKTGKMHGYMRMYWAKKILEWTDSVDTAMSIAIYLNDTYSLDGRDPNGYVGIAWSIGGVHDRAWFERPVFGKVRYMNYNGCASKFDVKEYIRTHLHNLF